MEEKIYTKKKTSSELFSEIEVLIQKRKSSMHEYLNNEIIEKGSLVPYFELQDANGKFFKMRDIVGAKSLIIFFYDKNDEPLSIKQVCRFRDKLIFFENTDTMVVGINTETVEQNKEFSIKHNLNFKLLSDINNEVRDLFENNIFYNDYSSLRSTFVIDMFGYVIHIVKSTDEINQHIDESLEMLIEEF